MNHERVKEKIEILKDKTKFFFQDASTDPHPEDIIPLDEEIVLFFPGQSDVSLPGSD